MNFLDSLAGLLTTHRNLECDKEHQLDTAVLQRVTRGKKLETAGLIFISVLYFIRLSRFTSCILFWKVINN